MSATVPDAIRALCPTASYNIEGNDYNSIKWYSPNVTQPTEQEVNDEIIKLDLQAPLDACKKQASELLYETDWTTIADVADPAKSQPYLLNPQDFVTYRSALRKLAVYPEASPVWPTKPQEQWSSV
jgi:hypothetical protein